MKDRRWIWVALLIGLSSGIAGPFHQGFGAAPVLAAVLWAACFLKPGPLFGVGVGGMLVRDLLLGLSVFTLVRVVGIALVALIFLTLRIRPAVRPLLIGLLVAAPAFHLALAVGDWLTGTCALYPKTAEGLLLSIRGSIPYFQRSFFGDFLFTALFLAAYFLVSYSLLRVPARAVSGNES